MPSHLRPRQSSNTTAGPDPAANTFQARPASSSRPQSPATLPPSAVRVPQYTVFIRLPVLRGSFQDPAPANWNATKDEQLWRLISKASSNDLCWEGLSREFDVELSFLLTQAAWLTERHMERMRRQVGRIGGRAVGDKGHGTGSGPAVGGVGAWKTDRGGSQDSKMPSGSTATTVRRGCPAYPSPIETGGLPASGTPTSGRPSISRTPSSATVTQSKISGSTSKHRPLRERALHGSSGSTRRPARLSPSAPSSPPDAYYEDAIEQEGPSESESEEEPSAMTRSQAFRRPLISKKAKPTLATLASDGDGEADDDDDDSGPDGYLPFAAAPKPGDGEDVAATLRGSQRPAQQPVAQPTTRAVRPRVPIRTATTTTESSASSVSSAGVVMYRKLSTDSENPRRSSADIPSSSGNRHHRRASIGSTAPRPPGPLSPRHRAQLVSLSPRHHQREGSEGSPSMGSSFSDLDDASVTQSALEDALMSNIRAQGGSMLSLAGRMSALRDTLGRRNV